MRTSIIVTLGVIFGMTIVAYVMAMAISAFGGFIQGPPNDSTGYIPGQVVERVEPQFNPQTLEDQSSRPVMALTPPTHWATRGATCVFENETTGFINSGQCVPTIYRRPNGAVVISLISPQATMFIVASEPDGFNVQPNFIYGSQGQTAYTMRLDQSFDSYCNPADTYITCTARTENGQILNISFGD